MSVWFSIMIAAALGWSLARAALCGVAATQEAIVQQRASGLYFQAITVTMAGITLLGLSWFSGDIGRLPGDSGTRMAIVLASIVLALGGMLNGGCYLGSVMYLGRGKANYLFSLLGIAVASRTNLPSHWGIAAHGSLRPQPPNTILWTAIFVFAVLCSLAAWGVRRENGRKLDSRLGHALLAGLMAGSLMILLPSWNYAAFLNGIAYWHLEPLHWPLVLPALALFGGAVASCIAAGTWAPAAPTLVGASRCLVGGFIMESAARCIPGGNDVLLMWTMPGLGAYGLLAYSVLLSTMMLGWRLVSARKS